ncbi:FAD-dependent oxidoreductase [Companilactobacillus ginsenosidimutans]|uniref:Fumarate reductase n=1 Tax=Companilactobacillus ginsenosidimutans TaxID=1007676 RepID=A0A0H4R0M6_9LACO|nr:FAD-dependent oxidoreductase [Companilactobacillus ginsenosidimutans]AKP67280.1 fumarate reductase [Companilactobacillus ginsenosidimutans]
MSLTKNKSYDLVIIGAGASGFTAAYQAAKNGLSVVVLEKGRHTGGSGDWVEGIFAVDSKMQKAKNVELTKDEVLNEELEYSHYEADTNSWKQYIDHSAEMIDWLKDLGVKYVDVKGLGSGHVTWHLMEGNGKQAIHTAIEPNTVKAGAEIVTSVAAKSLIKDDQGKICGVEIQDQADRHTEKINTRAVIIATGGYLNNQQLIDQDTNYNAKQLIPVNSGKNTGDGLKLAWDVGAQKYRMGMAMLFGGYVKDTTNPSYIYRTSDMNGAVTQQSLLWVNEKGDRFTNEEVVDNFAHAGNALFTQNKIFAVIDQGTIDHLMNVGLYKDMGTYFTTQKTLDGLQKEIDDSLDKKLPFIYKAETLADLGEKADLPNLEKTIDRYNQLSQKGEDTDYHKNSKFMVSLEKGPYYAFELGIGAFCTMGGLKVDLDNRVLDNDGQVIDGLYAAGNDAAGMLVGDTYGPNMPGTEGGYAFYSGRHSANTVAKYLKDTAVLN